MSDAAAEPAVGEQTRAEEPSDSPHIAREPSRYSRDFWLVFAATFALNTVGNLFVLYPLWVVELGGGAGAIGAVIGTGSLAAPAVRPWVGALIDRRGRRWTALSFLWLDALAIALYLPIRALGSTLFAVRAIHGAIEGTARVALFAMVYEILPQGAQGRGMATFSLCGMIPAAFAPLFGEALIKRSGFTAFFLLSIALVAAGGFTALALRDDSSAGAAHSAASGTRYAALLRDRRMLPLWTVTLLFALAISSRLSFVAPYAYQCGVARAGWYFAIYSLAAIAVRIGSGRIIDRFGLEATLAPALVILGIGLALIAGAGLPGALDAAAVVGGLGHGYFYPAVSALVIARTSAGAMGRSSSIYTSLYDIGAMAGPYLLGGVAVTAGYGIMFLISGAIAIVGAAYFVAVEPAARHTGTR